MKRTSRNRFLMCLIPAALLTLAAAVFLWQFFGDNKYYGRSPALVSGAAVVGGESVYALTDGWDVFYGLLTPDETRAAEPAARGVRIGDSPNLIALTGGAEGSVTYRVYVSGNGDCALYLPEVFTSSAVYADGELLGGTGDPAAGTPYVRDAVYAFDAGEKTEIVVQVTAGGHYYGGIYYPPLAGDPSAVARTVAARTAVYACAAVFILAAVLLSVPLFKRGDRKTGVPFLLVCVFTALALLYPFVTAAGIGAPVALYTLTDVSSALALLFAITLAAALTGRTGSSGFLCGGFPLALGLALFSAVMPPLLLLIPDFATVYGYIVAAVKALLGAYLAATSAAGFIKALKKGGTDFMAALTLTGGVVYALFIVAGVATIGFFEPIVSFWCEESGALTMAILFAAAVFVRARKVVRENKQLNERLGAEAERADALAGLFAERGKLIKSVSHDLKTPVTAIGAYAEELLAHGDADAKTRRGLELITQRLADFAARYGVLEELGTETPAPLSPVCLNDFVREWTESYRDDVEMDGAALIVDLYREKLTVPADKGKLSRILENLVFNAVSFTPAGGKITVSLRRNGNDAELAVADTGAGIPAELLPRVFEPYVSGRDNDDGRGLGLFIVKTLTAALSGRVTARSTSGYGTVFTVSLPLGEER